MAHSTPAPFGVKADRPYIGDEAIAANLAKCATLARRRPPIAGVDADIPVPAEVDGERVDVLGADIDWWRQASNDAPGGDWFADLLLDCVPDDGPGDDGAEFERFALDGFGDEIAIEREEVERFFRARARSVRIDEAEEAAMLYGYRGR